jgi:hypothetical protein
LQTARRQSSLAGICLQAEVPGGGQFQFRNIRIAEPAK